MAMATESDVKPLRVPEHQGAVVSLLRLDRGLPVCCKFCQCIGGEELDRDHGRPGILNGQDVFEERNYIEPLERSAAQPSVIQVVAVDVDSGAFDRELRFC